MPGAGEYPVAGLPIPAGLLPHPEISGYTLIEWQRLARCFRLAIPSMSQINGVQDIEAHVGEINIAPFEGQQFATTESRCHSQQHHQESAQTHRARVCSLLTRASDTTLRLLVTYPHVPIWITSGFRLADHSLAIGRGTSVLCAFSCEVDYLLIRSRSA
jgi:hypothetical protein